MKKDPTTCILYNKNEDFKAKGGGGGVLVGSRVKKGKYFGNLKCLLMP